MYHKPKFWAFFFVLTRYCEVLEFFRRFLMRCSHVAFQNLDNFLHLSKQRSVNDRICSALQKFKKKKEKACFQNYEVTKRISPFVSGVDIAMLYF